MNTSVSRLCPWFRATKHLGHPLGRPRRHGIGFLRRGPTVAYLQ